MDEIKDRGSINLFLEAQYPPFEFVDESGEIVGYDLDLADIIFKQRLGVDLEITNIGFDGLLPALEQGQADALPSGIRITCERLETFDYSLPYFEVVNTFLVVEGSPLTELSDLEGKVVGIQLGTTSEDDIVAFEQEELIAKGKAGLAEVKKYDNIGIILEELKLGRVDALFDSTAGLGLALRERGDEFELLDFTGPPAYFGWVFQKGDDELVDFVNTELRKLKSDGTLSQLMQTWFGQEHVSRLPDELPAC